MCRFKLALPALLVALLALGFRPWDAVLCQKGKQPKPTKPPKPQKRPKPEKDARVNMTAVYVPRREALKEWELATSSWQPKLIGSPQAQSYDPATVDWVSVMSACRAVILFEKRFASFFTRAAAHDSLAVDSRACVGEDDARSIGCGGADGSLFLTLEELLRPENQYDQFAPLAGRVVIKFASWFDISVADTLAVCAAVAPWVLTNGTRAQIITPTAAASGAPFLVGRLDSLTPADAGELLGALPPDFASVEYLDAFWRRRGLSAEEGWALMGSHALIDEQGCFQGPSRGDYCQLTNINRPRSAGYCSDVRMFKWENHYYHDACTATIKVTPVPPEQPEPEETPILGMRDDEFSAELRSGSCTFSSPFFRNLEVTELEAIRRGQIPDPDLAVPPEPYVVRWSNEYCPASSAITGANPAHCPHSTVWFYTIADAFAAEACQATSPSLPEAQSAARAAYRKYLDQREWDVAYARALKKMVSKKATWVDKYPGGYPITGQECPGGYVADKRWCEDDVKTRGKAAFDLCSGCTTGGSCNPCCRCRTLFTRGWTTRLPDVTRQLLERMFQQPPSPPPMPPAPPLAPVPLQELPDATDSDDTSKPLPSSFTYKPPYDDPSDVCPTTGKRVLVRGYPSSPFAFKPFQLPFKPPKHLQPSTRVCRRDGSHCVVACELDVFASEANFTCPGPLTKLLTYGGSSPGPTITVTKGTEALVRFNNKIRDDDGSGLKMFLTRPPCSTTPGLYGRPIAVHFHGSASLAPYDGWAEDSICTGQTKDYILPANRAVTGWYHDHQLEITAENAYYGLAGFYLVSDRVAEGGCGLPFNLDTVPETEMMLADKVLDKNCQLYYDVDSYHRNNLYGDIILVSGTPWPVMTFKPTWHRLRLLNAGPVRPYKLRVVTASGDDWSGRSGLCYVVAGDGGFKQTPTPFPAAGLFIGVAERYEVVCNLEAAAGQQLYLVNVKDEDRMKDVPFFCYSHLVARLDVLTLDGQLPEGAGGSDGSTDVLGEDDPDDPDGPEDPLEPADPVDPVDPVDQVDQVDPVDTKEDPDEADDKDDTEEPVDQVDPGFDQEDPLGDLGIPVIGSGVRRRLLAKGESGKADGASNAKGKAKGEAKAGPDPAVAETPTPTPVVVPLDPVPSSSSASSTSPPALFDASAGQPTSVDAVIGDAVFDRATQMAVRDNCTRYFKFGRRRGHWVINGEDWHSLRIAASDVGQNTWEVWCLKTGGGWFHPIHIHLVDFYVIARNQDPAQVHSYERRTPKDVVQLDPSAEVSLLIRFGPHRGDYMFHCHNLVHEDHEMMRAFSVVPYRKARRPSDDWAKGLANINGVVYDKYKDPLYDPAYAKSTVGYTPLVQAASNAVRDNLYRIFYPTKRDKAVLLSYQSNPWRVQKCPAAY